MTREDRSVRRPRTREGSILLTKNQLAAWQSFGPEWDGFKRAWLGRGLLWPPSGDRSDEDSDSVRSRLWSILDDWPTRTPQWVREAPGHSAREVVGYIFDCYNGLRDDINRREDEQEAAWEEVKHREKKEAKEAWARLKDMFR